MVEKREWAARQTDHLRRALMLEPRGHTDMFGAVLTEPVSPGSHAGVLFMDNEGYGTLSAHGIIAVTTIALERGLLMPGGDGRLVTFDTPGGTVRATAHRGASPAAGGGGAGGARGAGVAVVAGRPGEAGGQGRTRPAETAGGAGEARGAGKTGGPGGEGIARVEHVSFVNVPSFVLQGGVEVAVGGRRVRADISYGGAFYAIVDSESAGVALDRLHLPELRRTGLAITRAVNAMFTAAHPLEPRLSGIDATIFTGPPHGHSADLRSVAVFAGGAVDRSACETGTAAVMAVIDAMGLLDDERPFVHESIIGTTLSGRVVDRTAVGDYRAIVPEILGSAWITGDHTFMVDPADPLHAGFRL